MAKPNLWIFPHNYHPILNKIYRYTSRASNETVQTGINEYIICIFVM